MPADDPRLLLLGGGGRLGGEVRAHWSGAVDAPPKSAFDLTRGDADALVAASRPDVVVNCAAFHYVDGCEGDPDYAFAVHAHGVERLAAACARANVPFVTISSDYVFAGTATEPYRERDVPSPRTMFGSSKAAGELLVRRHGPRHIIVRTSALFGARRVEGRDELIDRVLARAASGESLRMVDDVTSSVSYTPHVAERIVELIRRDAFGTHHVTNAGAVTWFGFMQRVLAAAGLGDFPLERVPQAQFGLVTVLPSYTVLENTTFAELGLAPLPPWQDAVDACLAARLAEPPQRV